jgi:hypothetical protein
MLFVYSDHDKTRLDLRGESLPKAFFLTDTLGSGRVFCFQGLIWIIGN